MMALLEVTCQTSPALTAGCLAGKPRALGRLLFA